MDASQVLVIEDNDDIARLLELHLTGIGCRTTRAGDGEAGLAAVERSRFDLVVLDLMLPGIDGLEVCRRLRAGYERGCGSRVPTSPPLVRPLRNRGGPFFP